MCYAVLSHSVLYIYIICIYNIYIHTYIYIYLTALHLKLKQYYKSTIVQLRKKATATEKFLLL